MWLITNIPFFFFLSRASHLQRLVQTDVFVIICTDVLTRQNLPRLPERGTHALSVVSQTAASALMAALIRASWPGWASVSRNEDFFTFAAALLVLAFSLQAQVLSSQFPLRAASPVSTFCFSPIWCGRRSSAASLQMAFLPPALAVILVCVFKYSERSPLGVFMFTKALTGSPLVLWGGGVMCSFALVKNIAQPEKDSK